MCPALRSTTTPSGTRAPLTMTFRSDPSAAAERIRPPLASRKNNRPVAALPPVVGVAFNVSVALMFLTSFSSFRAPTFQDLLGCLCRCDWFPDHAAIAQALDFFRVEPEFSENFVVVFAKIGRAPCRDFRDAVHLYRTADSKLHVLAGAFERHKDVVSL